LIQRSGAMDSVQKGDYQTAINKLGGVWASLPSSKYNQPKKSQ
jgi:muramidase (phage lysozyme)